MYFYDIVCKDRVSREEVIIAASLTHAEALEVMKFMDKYNACECYAIRYFMEKGKVIYE